MIKTVKKAKTIASQATPKKAASPVNKKGKDDERKTFGCDNTIMFHTVFDLSSNECLLIYELHVLVNKSLPSAQ